MPAKKTHPSLTDLLRKKFEEVRPADPTGQTWGAALSEALLPLAHQGNAAWDQLKLSGLSTEELRVLKEVLLEKVWT